MRLKVRLSHLRSIIDWKMKSWSKDITKSSKRLSIELEWRTPYKLIEINPVTQPRWSCHLYLIHRTRAKVTLRLKTGSDHYFIALLIKKLIPCRSAKVIDKIFRTWEKELWTRKSSILKRIKIYMNISLKVCLYHLL